MARPSLVGVVGLILVALVIGSPAFDLIPSGNAGPTFATKVPQADDADATMLHPGSSSTTTLRWPATPGADYYDVVLWRDSRRQLDLWPKGTSLSVDATGSVGSETLPRGRYSWFVFPAFEELDGVRFGHEIAHGEFVVDPAGGTSGNADTPPLSTKAR